MTDTTRVANAADAGTFPTPFWAARGWHSVYAGQTVTLDAHREHIAFAPFTASDLTSVFDADPERVVIQTADGRVVEERTDSMDLFSQPDGSSTATMPTASPTRASP